jgi:putative transposase
LWAVDGLLSKFESPATPSVWLANQPPGTQRYRAIRQDEDTLTQPIMQFASQYGRYGCRYGYRRITALLQRAGWRVGKDRVERICVARG